MATNGQRNPGYKLTCDLEHGQVILSFPRVGKDGSLGGWQTWTLKGIPPFGVLRRLQENAEAIQKREDDNDPASGFATMLETLEWWRYAATSLGVTLPPADEMPTGLALQGPRQEALVHWLVCSVPTQASGPPARRPTRQPAKRPR